MHPARQFSGAGNATKRHMLPRIRCPPLTVDEASELLEYLSAPWT
jgi:hypothetical protein